jgi:hypothetical protein
MERAVRWIAVVTVIGLLAAILIMLVQVSRDGIRITYSGDLQIVGMPDEIALRMDEPVRLTMPEGAQLTTGLSDGQSIPLSISLAAGPNCDGPMIPVRWNPFTGKIEWRCLSSDDTSGP